MTSGSGALAWLRRLGRPARAVPSRHDLLNEGLELAMDWGEDWLAPIQERLHQRHPALPREQLDELDATCRAAMQLGLDTAHELVRAKGRQAGEPEFIALVVAQLPWITPANAARLFRQGMYYAWKTGGPPREP